MFVQWFRGDNYHDQNAANPYDGRGRFASAASKTYSVSITSPAWIGTNELKPGDYKLEIEGDHAVLRNGKTVLNVPAKIEAGNQKHSATAVTIDNQGSRAVLREIEVGGTPTTVVFSG